MTKQEFARAFMIAKGGQDLTNSSIDHFYGFGLPDFGKTTCTVDQLARLIRYQAQYLSGGWDMDALNEVREYGRKRFEVLD